MVWDLRKKTEFTVCHYAAKVEYIVDGFMEKNTGYPSTHRPQN